VKHSLVIARHLRVLIIGQINVVKVLCCRHGRPRIRCGAARAITAAAPHALRRRSIRRTTMAQLEVVSRAGTWVAWKVSNNVVRPGVVPPPVVRHVPVDRVGNAFRTLEQQIIIRTARKGTHQCAKKMYLKEHTAARKGTHQRAEKKTNNHLFKTRICLLKCPKRDSQRVCCICPTLDSRLACLQV
jgi:hypothetical protein